MFKLNSIKENSGLILLIISLVFYFLIKLPFDLSITCTSLNEGFYFVFGQHLLDTHKFDFVRGPLFIFIYTLVLKIFGFNTGSIIAVHFLQTFIVVLIGISLFYLGKIVLKSNFFAGLTVLFWIILQITPLGIWGAKYEQESTFALEGEYFSVLFSILSIIFIFKTFSSDKGKFLYFFAGILSSLAFASKASGIVIFIAITFWQVYLLIFKKDVFKTTIKSFAFFLFGFFFLFVLFSGALALLDTNPFLFWRDSFLVGSYSKRFLNSPYDFLLNVYNFMTRGNNSFSNLILFFITFISLIWGLIRGNVLKIKNDFVRVSWVLLSIWGIGNVLVVIAPGEYASYYYVLVWPVLSLFLCLMLRDLISFVPFFEKSFVRGLIAFLIAVFFIQRLIAIFPSYNESIKTKLDLSIFSQPQSFQDPVVLPYNPVPKNRTLVLWVADLINNQLPNKNDKFYVFNFFRNFSIFSANIYIYAKRSCSTSVLSDLLLIGQVSEDRSERLKSDLTKSLPEIVVLPKELHMNLGMVKSLTPFVDWLNLFLKKNYHFEVSFDILYSKREPETCYVYRKN